MKSITCVIVSLLALVSYASVILADTSTVDVKIDSIDVQRRILTILYSGKSRQLEIASDATIEINGKKSQCDSLASGDQAAVTFDKQRAVITKIVVGRKEMPGKEDPFDSANRSSNKKSEDDATAQGDGKVQTIVAEGVGANADDAIKDAFRNAVRQVVGAVVDAETLLKNDELIDDQVLTYSDGFVKKFTEVEGSKKVSGGLHRIKIKADVERRSVIAKLKAAKISVKEVDGKSMFAEVVSQLDAEKDASAILAKQFEGFPLSYISASVIGKPEILDKNDSVAKIKVVVRIEPDLEAYKAFATKLTSALEKMAVGKGEFSATSILQQDGPWFGNRQNALWFGNRVGSKWIPNIWDRNVDIFAIAVATSRNKLGDKFECKCYRIDPKLRDVILQSLNESYNIKLQFLDSDGTPVDTVRVESRGSNPEPNREAGRAISERKLFIAFDEKNDNTGESIQYLIEKKNGAFEWRCRLAFIAPTFCTDHLFHYPAFNIPIITEVSLDELKSFKDIKVELYTD